MKRILQALLMIGLGFLGMGLFQVARSIYLDLAFLHQARIVDDANQATRRAIETLKQQQGAGK